MGACLRLATGNRSVRLDRILRDQICAVLLNSKSRSWKEQVPFNIRRKVLDQAGGCEVCGGRDEGKRLALDHCHETGVVRGMLCQRCNTAIGQMRDDPSLLRRAAAYLEQFTQHIDL